MIVEIKVKKLTCTPIYISVYRRFFLILMFRSRIFLSRSFRDPFREFFRNSFRDSSHVRVHLTCLHRREERGDAG